jgi:hypothetical protein
MAVSRKPSLADIQNPEQLDSQADESGVSAETEPEDISPVDAAMVQDRFDQYASMSPEPVEVDPEPVKKLVQAPDKIKKETPKAGPPSLDEWQAFIGRFVVRTLTDAYLSYALRDIEAELTPRERDMISLSKEDISELSAPLATLANKNRLARKHGRSIIAAADSYESVIAMAMWMRRVNKIAKKYRPSKPKANRVIRGEYQEGMNNGSHGPYEGEGPEFQPPGFGVFNPGSGG